MRINLPEDHSRNIPDLHAEIGFVLSVSAGEIGDYNLRHSLSREVNDCTVKIKAIAMSLME
ncbi:MAG: hypothetical protein PUB85_05645 [Clostridia bacterium]|nr:hypothetical protein [Clostridia bacterium]